MRNYSPLQRSLNQIQRVLRWCKEHEDWSLYILSPQNRQVSDVPQMFISNYGWADVGQF